MFVQLVCLVLAALSVEAGEHYGSGLYDNYHGEYAAAYDNYEPRTYAFEYGVADPHTGDFKNQWETKDKAGVVRGSYSLLEPDGSTRIVDYIADKDGFRAVVKKVGIHGHPESIQSHGGAVEEAKALAPIIVAEHEHVEQPVGVEEGPVFHSYDGGIEDYQYIAQPLHFAPQPAYFVPKEEIYLQPQPVLAQAQHEFAVPKAEGLFTPPHFIASHQKSSEDYQQPVALGEPFIGGYQPLFVNAAAGLHPSVSEKQFVGAPQPSLEKTQPLPEFVVPEQKISVAPPPPRDFIVPDRKFEEVAYRQPEQFVPQAALPETSYQLEQSFGPPHGYISQPGHFVVHPHGESPQSYHGTTGNLEDDSLYTNYDGHQEGKRGIELNQGEYLPAPSKLEAAPVLCSQPLPYKLVTGHPILK